MQIGVDSFVATALDASRDGARGDVTRVQELLEQVELADQVGLDVFGIGEHHRADYVASAPAVLLAAAAARTKHIRLVSAVTVLSSDDPVRVFQQFATLDLISHGRAEIIIGRGSFIESYPLFGFDLENYDELFSEKLELLLKLRDQTKVTWSGKYRPSLTGQGVYPRPLQNPLPVWIGVGGTPESAIRAGKLGLPLMLAIIGGQSSQFRPLVDLYRRSGKAAGHAPEKLTVGVHSIGFLADTTSAAQEIFWPAYRDAFGKIGRERGWAAPTRPQFDAQASPIGRSWWATRRRSLPKFSPSTRRLAATHARRSCSIIARSHTGRSCAPSSCWARRSRRSSKENWVLPTRRIVRFRHHRGGELPCGYFQFR